MQHVNLEDIESKINLVYSQIQDFRPLLNNKTLSLYEPHLEYLSGKLYKITEILQTFKVSRVKRGLINGLGSIIKSISGNLDYTDAIRYENALKVLKENQFKLESEYNNHISLTREFLQHHTKILNTIVENQDKINETLNYIMEKDFKRETELIRYAHLSQYLLILGDNIDSLTIELVNLGNMLNLSFASSTAHSIISVAMLRSMISKIKVLYSSKFTLDIDLREYFRVMKFGYYYLDDKIVLVFKVPIVLPKPFDLFKLSAVPNRNHQILIPMSPYIAIQERDSRYIETECLKANSAYYICEENPAHTFNNHDECIHTLITKQQLLPSCKLTSISQESEAFEQLDQKHYILSFPKSTKIQSSCGKLQYKTLNGSYLAIIPQGCSIQTPEFTISNSNDIIKGQPLRISDIVPVKENQPSEHILNLKSINLEKLHKINSEIMAQPKIDLRSSQDLSIYHTTIPVYLILIIAITICMTMFLYQHFRKLQPSMEHKETQNPGEVRVDPSSIPATILRK